jgi:formate hydrogenlyase subunit 5
MFKKIRATIDDWYEELISLKKKQAILLTLAGTDEREVNGKFGVYSVFFLPEEKKLVELALALEPESLVYPSVTSVFPSAHWLEREIKDMFGIIPQGHPDLRRLAVHPDWPKDVFPLRKDFSPDSEVPRIQGKPDFCKVKGKGLYQIPVGPIHAGIIEPGHFRFFAFGEDVIDLQAQLFYTHRGVEKTAEGKHFQHVSLLAERICGACSVSHAAAYAQAVESLAKTDIPPPSKTSSNYLAGNGTPLQSYW